MKYIYWQFHSTQFEPLLEAVLPIQSASQHLALQWNLPLGMMMQMRILSWHFPCVLPLSSVHVTNSFLFFYLTISRWRVGWTVLSSFSSRRHQAVSVKYFAQCQRTGYKFSPVLLHLILVPFYGVSTGLCKYWSPNLCKKIQDTVIMTNMRSGKHQQLLEREKVKFYIQLYRYCEFFSHLKL